VALTDHYVRTSLSTGKTISVFRASAAIVDAERYDWETKEWRPDAASDLLRMLSNGEPDLDRASKATAMRLIAEREKGAKR
jgi:hypothetical protein